MLAATNHTVLAGVGPQLIAHSHARHSLQHTLQAPPTNRRTTHSHLGARTLVITSRSGSKTNTPRTLTFLQPKNQKPNRTRYNDPSSRALPKEFVRTVLAVMDHWTAVVNDAFGGDPALMKAMITGLRL
jgi:hypothetical protein